MNRDSYTLLPCLCRWPSLVLLGWLCTATAGVPSPRQLERLDRGLVAIVQPDGGVYVGWRLLATDPPHVAFHLYRASGTTPHQEGSTGARLTFLRRSQAK